MNIRQRIGIVALTLAAAIAAPCMALAHHSAAEWDLSRRISVTGAVKVVQFRNPHGHMEIAVTDPKGKTVDWNVETSAINLLVRRGWKPDRVKVGDKITIIGHPHKSQPSRLYLREVRLADGTTFGDLTGNDKALD